MLFQRSLKFEMLPCKILKKYSSFSNHHSFSFSSLHQPNLLIRPKRFFAERPYFCFSNVKKTSKTGQKQTFKILKTSMSTDQKGERYLVLYNAEKQTTSFRLISVMMLLFFGLSITKIYHTDSQDRRDDYIILAIVVGSFLIYQRRIIKTVKKITLNSKGDRLFVTTFDAMAKGQRTLSTPIQLMTGYRRATRLGGYILHAGGKSTGFQEKQFWFTARYITDRPVFDYVSTGKRPKIVDQFSTL